MEATVNSNAAVSAPPAPARTSAPAVPPVAAPAAAPRKQVNWSMVVRVGLVVGLVLALVGYALKVTYESVIQGGVVAAGEHFKVELKQMSNFEMDQSLGTAADVPERFRQLNGKKVILEGEVAPAGTTSGNRVNEFSLCYSVAKCCFGGPPKVQHFVTCKTPPNRTAPNYEGSGVIRVYGTLHVRVIKNETGKIESVFQLDLDRAEPVS